jgi:hypothetical protein
MFLSSRTKNRKDADGYRPTEAKRPDRHRPGSGITQLTGKFGSTPGFPGASGGEADARYQGFAAGKNVRRTCSGP